MYMGFEFFSNHKLFSIHIIFINKALYFNLNIKYVVCDDLIANKCYVPDDACALHFVLFAYL